MKFTRVSLTIIGVAFLAVVGPPNAGAQGAVDRQQRSTVFVGSDGESYLRLLQTLGLTALQPFSARGFSESELAKLAPGDTGHPWALLEQFHARRHRLGGVAFEIAPLTAFASYNTTFPFGINDGAVWQGRGLTVAAQGGIATQWRWLSATIAPSMFIAENRAFPLMPGSNSPQNLADVHGGADWPQRFGTRSYARLDPGQSAIRVNAFGALVGFSTQNEWWGPMMEYPYILGNNAAGFPHLVLGTASPRNVWIGRGHIRVLYGRLKQSPFSRDTILPIDRFGAGMVAVLEPRIFPGLELGVTRFFHVEWPASGPTSEYFTHLFEGFLKSGLSKVFLPKTPTIPGEDPNQSGDNQLASAFARWVLPRNAAEVYVEFGREDHSWNSRDLISEPDHSASVGVGFRKAWQSDGRVRSLRLENINFLGSALGRNRPQGGAYYHSNVKQGHTQLGQLLGSGFAIGEGAASTVALESYTAGGFRSLAWSRRIVRKRNSLQGLDVQQILSYERRRMSKRETRSAGTDVVCELNRYFTHDKCSVRLRASTTLSR